MSTTTKETHPTEEAVPSSQKAPPVTETAGEAMLLPKVQLISFGERLTYTFSHGREVGSIHFDRARGEIFFKGHNIRNMDLEEWQMQMLEGLRKMLWKDEQVLRFAEHYGKALDKVVLEKSSRT